MPAALLTLRLLQAPVLAALPTLRLLQAVLPTLHLFHHTVLVRPAAAALPDQPIPPAFIPLPVAIRKD